MLDLYAQFRSFISNSSNVIAVRFFFKEFCLLVEEVPEEVTHITNLEVEVGLQKNNWSRVEGS